MNTSQTRTSTLDVHSEDSINILPETYALVISGRDEDNIFNSFYLQFGELNEDAMRLTALKLRQLAQALDPLPQITVHQPHSIDIDLPAA